METETEKSQNVESASSAEENVDENPSADVKMAAKTKKVPTPGVIYLSNIPKKMNVKIIRDYFSNFGEVDRIFLEPREKKRKSEQRSFSEGWVEFKRKKIAKQVARDLNNNQVGGKRRNPWYHELWNMKYLKNFRWTHLNERIAYEQEQRKQRLRQEIALAKKESNFYIQNVEKNEKRKRFEKKSLKEGTNNVENASENTKNRSANNSEGKDTNNDENESSFFKSKHPVFERKTKVVGNDSFLKQIFS